MAAWRPLADDTPAEVEERQIDMALLTLGRELAGRAYPDVDSLTEP